jgi:hypothetical protein
MWEFKKLSTCATLHVINIPTIVQCLQAKVVHFLKILKKLLIIFIAMCFDTKIKFPKMHDIRAKKTSKSEKQLITLLYHNPQYNGYDKFIRIP